MRMRISSSTATSSRRTSSSRRTACRSCSISASRGCSTPTLVVAHADTALYRAAKFVRRNRVAVAAGALVVVALGGGVAATAWQARVARHEARLAAAAQARAERRFEDVRSLARAVIFDYHDAI